MTMRALPIVLVLALAACGGEPEEDAASIPEGEVATRLLLPPMFPCAVEEPADLVIRDPKAWLDLWRRVAAGLAPMPAAPVVDFSREMVLASFMGHGPRGRALAIHRVEREGDRLIVTVAVRENAMGGAAATSGPGSIVAIPRTSMQIEWRRVDARGGLAAGE